MSKGTVNGWLNVLKPVGMTSFDAVRAVQKIVGTQRVGHAGTLDPDAIGVLPMAVGAATRLLEWCDDVPKVYRGWMVLGSLTTTGDAGGVLNAQSGLPYPDLQNIEWALPFLMGSILQTPPQVSALKQRGRTLHDLVRQGRSVWPGPRRVEVYRLEIIQGSSSRWQVEAEVGKGTYMRSLVRDLGDILGHASHLEALERRRVGVYRWEQGVPLADLGQHWRDLLKPTAWGLCIPRVCVDRERLPVIAHGQPILDWHELENYRGEVALVAGSEVVSVVAGPPWKYRKVLIHAIGEGIDG